MTHIKHLNPIDPEVLRRRAKAASPVPHLCLDDFLEPGFAEGVAASFPSFEEARRVGRGFSAVNERGKVQVTDASTFAGPVAELNRTLASPEFLGVLSHAFEMPGLVADEELVGGGIHQTGPRGHLDVHVDFNYLEGRELHRRLNILVYFNRGWRPEYGGEIELWDEGVRACEKSFSPTFNRCVIFETNEVSFHGVTAVRCPPGSARRSFAAYYYTREAPPHWAGRAHSTIFKARPGELLKGGVMMPLEKAGRRLRSALSGLKARVTS